MTCSHITNYKRKYGMIIWSSRFITITFICLFYLIFSARSCICIKMKQNGSKVQGKKKPSKQMSWGCVSIMHVSVIIRPVVPIQLHYTSVYKPQRSHSKFKGPRRHVQKSFSVWFLLVYIIPAHFKIMLQMVQMLYLGRNVVTEGYEKLLSSTVWTTYSINIAPGKRSYCSICTTGQL